jgi:hypothetical protein
MLDGRLKFLSAEPRPAPIDAGPLRRGTHSQHPDQAQCHGVQRISAATSERALAGAPTTV